nr:acyltransferase [Sphingomonas sp. CROZ-RG-20F-R02-07]
MLTSLLFIPADNKAASQPFPILTVGWTLNLEMFFYAIFALALLLPQHQRLAGISVVFDSLIALGFALSVHAVPWSLWTSPMIFEFLAGAWIGGAWRRGASLVPVTIVMASIGAALCGLTFAFTPGIYLQTPYTGLRVFTVPIFVVLLSTLLHLERRGTGIRSHPLPRLIGDASYSIYLWQFFPVMIFARYLGSTSLAYGLAVILGGIAGGLLAYRWLERPLRRLFGQPRQGLSALQKSPVVASHAAG